MFARALVRPPAPNFALGLSSSGLLPPDFGRALEQHRAYCLALRAAGLELIELAPDPEHPDAPFVEDTAICTARGAIVTRPGAPTRRGEVDAIEAALAPHFPRPGRIVAPGTVDGGDVCQIDGHFLIGISYRTNGEGASQLARLLHSLGYTAATVDIRHRPELLHLKSGLSWLGGDTVVASAGIAGDPALAPYRVLVPDADDSYAANCVRVNAVVLLPAGFAKLERELERAGFHPVALAMSEFRSMDGGLSCLSLRF